MSEEKRKYILAQLNSLPNAFQYMEVKAYIKELEQKNEQLKFKLEYEKENLKFRNDYANNLKQELDLYKSVVDEVREYIDLEFPLEIRRYKALEILDKVKGDSND